MNGIWYEFLQSFLAYIYPCSILGIWEDFQALGSPFNFRLRLYNVMHVYVLARSVKRIPWIRIFINILIIW